MVVGVVIGVSLFSCRRAIGVVAAFAPKRIVTPDAVAVPVLANL